jgi:uncharacterized protein YdhG (YjbR/CyaY superfamily)
MNATRKSAKRTTRTSTSAGVLTEEELAALKETVQERKAEARRGKAEDKAAEDAAAVLQKIAEMPHSDRVIAERFHAIVKESAPSLSPKLWYGMPAYANEDGKVVAFFQAAEKFKARYATFGFNEDANLDDGNMWPTSWALTKLTSADEKKIAALLKKAAS